MQENIKNGKPEIECLSCIHDNDEFCNCIIFSGDIKLQNLYKRRK